MAGHYEFTVARHELAFWNIDMQDLVEPARATVWIGCSPATLDQCQALVQS
jgi:hypothetical protein